MWLHFPNASASRRECSTSAPATEGSDSASESRYQGLERSATWRGKPLPRQSWRKQWLGAFWMRRLSGLTCAPSTLDRCWAEWTSSLPASPVSPGAMRASAAVLRTSDSTGSGLPSCGSSPSADQPSSCSRTSSSTPSRFRDLTWKDWSTKSRQRSKSLPATWALRTSGSGGGRSQSTPTPTVADSRSSRNATAGRRPGSKGKPGTTLCDYVVMYPTPTAVTYGYNQGGAKPTGKVRMSLESMARQASWPTPTARDWRSASTSGIKREGGQLLPEAVGGLLNPEWVEWLMGLPIGLTGYGPSAMELFRWRRLSRSTFCSAVRSADR